MDIKKELEESMQASRRQHAVFADFIQTVIDADELPCCMWDFEGDSFLYCNIRFATALGYTQAEILSLKYKDLIHPEDYQRSMTERETNISSKGIVNLVRGFQNRFRKKDGTDAQMYWATGINDASFYIGMGQVYIDEKPRAAEQTI